MDDLISRASAIDIVRFECGEWEGLAKTIIKRFEQLPSTQSERKGKWVGYDGDWLKTMCKCSECGAMIDVNEKYRNFFCYHCGARMDGGQGGEENR